jgi:hypothetical protein
MPLAYVVGWWDIFVDTIDNLSIVWHQAVSVVSEA